VPTLTFTGALALGALAAPPDPVAVEAVAGKVNMPRRLLTLLQTEGLFNDAIAIVLFTLAGGRHRGRVAKSGGSWCRSSCSPPAWPW
jgi:NhaP-type Na+/H+ or K+/H+ antiporter